MVGTVVKLRPGKGVNENARRCGWRKRRALEISHCRAAFRDDAANFRQQHLRSVGLLNEGRRCLAGEAADDLTLAETAHQQHLDTRHDHAHGVESLLAVHLRHGEIQHDCHNQSAVFTEHLQALGAVGSRQHLIPGFLQSTTANVTDRFFIIHHEDGARGLLGRCGPGFLGAPHHGRIVALPRRFEEHTERAADIFGAGNCKDASLAADDAHHGGKSQPAAHEFGGEERIEHARFGGFIHAATVIFHLEHDIFVVQFLGLEDDACEDRGIRHDLTRGDFHRSALAVQRLYGVHHEVHDQLAHLHRVAEDRRNTWFTLKGDVCPAGIGGTEERDGVARNLVHVNGTKNEPAAASIGKQLTAEVGGALRVFLDVREADGHLRSSRRVFAHHRGIADDAGEKVVEIMRDAACKHSKAFKALRFLETVADKLPVTLGAFAFCDVYERSDGTANPAFAIMQRCSKGKDVAAFAVLEHNVLFKLLNVHIFTGGDLKREILRLESDALMFDMEMMRGFVVWSAEGGILFFIHTQHFSQSSIGFDHLAGWIVRDTDAHRHHLEKCFKLLHTLLQNLVQSPDLRLSLFPLLNFLLQLGIYLGHARKGHRFGEMLHQKNDGCPGSNGGDDLHDGREVIDRLPEDDCLNQVRQSARKDEGRKEPVQLGMGDLAFLPPDIIGDRERDGCVGSKNCCIRQDMGPTVQRRPASTFPSGNEARRIEQIGYEQKHKLNFNTAHIRPLGCACRQYTSPEKITNPGHDFLFAIPSNASPSAHPGKRRKIHVFTKFPPLFVVPPVVRLETHEMRTLMPEMRIHTMHRIGLVLMTGLLLLSFHISLKAADSKVEFNRDVRPILSDKCFYCHGPDKNHRKADLRLDVRADAVSAKAISPGKPAESELIVRIFTANEDDLMPPPEAHKTLTQAQKELLKRWIEQGAEYQEHWAYLPAKRINPPTVENTAWVRNPIDAFIVAKLSASKLTPSPEADRRTLLRRLSLDLTGLPPTIEEVEAFLRDKSPRAYEKQVERLLRSPHYGERMAVPWLDAVRFTDTVGYHGDQNQNIFPYREYVINSFNSNKSFDQFTIEQLAGDLLPNPTTEQIIATGFNRLNMMTREGGAQPKEYLAKYAADRVRTVGTAWLGSTLGCAECHDHKFDPFTAKDFYSMAAYFADVKQWGVYSDYKYTPEPELKGFNNEFPFPPEMQVESPYLKERSTELRAKLEAIAETSAHGLGKGKETRDDYKNWRQQSLAWLKINPSGWHVPSSVQIATENMAKKNAKDKKAVAKQADYLSVTNARVEADGSIILPGKRNGGDRYEIKLPAMNLASLRLELLPVSPERPSILSGDSTASSIKFKAVLKRGGDAKPETLVIDHGMASHWEERYNSGSAIIGVRDMWKVSGKQLTNAQFAVWQFKDIEPVQEGDVLELTVEENTAGRVRWSVSPFATLDPLALDRSVALIGKHRSPTKSADLAGMFLLSSQADTNALAEFRKTRTDWLECRDGHAQTLITVAWQPKETRVLPRGNWQDESGKVVSPFPPEFLVRAKADESRRLSRLDLAKWIISPENPLTSRVIVNRLWKQFFGNGLYNSIEDIGAQGEWPSHPELLDWLAVEFRESGWDYRHMVRLMVMSSTYRQSSNLKREVIESDPENRLLASQNPRRLDAEFVRDNALFAAGILNLDVGGPSAKPYQPPGYYESLQFPDRDYIPHTDDRQYRRGLYMHWQRTFLHPMLANFDAPSREECTGVRVSSNTPQQALTLLNDPSFVEAARVLAQEAMTSGKNDARRLEFAFKRALAREPREAEKKSLLALLQKQTAYYQSSAEESVKLLKVGNFPRNESLPAYEHAAWTSVCRVILNLHETITRY